MLYRKSYCLPQILHYFHHIHNCCPALLYHISFRCSLHKGIILLSCKLVYSKCCDTNKHYCYQRCRYHFHSFVYFMSCNSYLWLFLITIPVATCFSATLSLLSAVRFASVLTLLLTFCLVSALILLSPARVLLMPVHSHSVIPLFLSEEADLSFKACFSSYAFLLAR